MDTSKLVPKGRTRINEGVIILYSRAIKQPGRTITIVCKDDAEATYLYKQFCNFLPRGRIKGVNSQIHGIELTNKSRFMFVADQKEMTHEQKS